MIHSTRLYTTVPLGDLLRARYNAGRIALPLEQNIFLRFKHVAGIPAPDGEGFSVNKLQLLDSLIENLKRLQGKAPSIPEGTRSSQEAFKALLDKLTEDLHQQIQRWNQTPFAPAVGAGITSLGTIVNMHV